MFYSALRIIKFSSTNIWRNFWLSFITTSTIIITLMSVSLVWALQIGLKQIISSAEKRIDMSVYFYPLITDVQANSVITALKTIPGVQEITFITKEQALANYEKIAKDSPELLDPLSAIGQNPFGSSIIIKTNAPSVYSGVIEELNKPQYKDLIEGQKKAYEENRLFIDSFSAFTNKIRLSGLIMSFIFAMIAVLLIFNAIRVAIYTQREEIAIMKLVGASNWFVRVPFLIETVIYSAIAIIISGGLFFALLYFVQPYLGIYFGGDVDLLGYFTDNTVTFLGFEFIVLASLNVLVGSLALRRYLKV